MAWLSDAVYTKELGVVYNLAPYAYEITVNFPGTFSQSQETGRGFSVASFPGLETRLVVVRLACLAKSFLFLFCL